MIILKLIVINKIMCQLSKDFKPAFCGGYREPKDFIIAQVLNIINNYQFILS